jgi:phosphonate transport system permease protein
MSDILIMPSARYKRKALYFSVAVIITAAACVYLDFNPLELFTDIQYLQNLVWKMFPPNFSLLLQRPAIGKSILQTLSMAFLATFYSCLIALILAFLSATNTMPYRWVRFVVGGVLSLTRVIPSLVVILIFVIAVGLGAFSGMLSIIVITVGLFGKLFIEIIENSEHSPAEAIFSVGATRLQVIRYGILPQIIPSFIANCLYAFDINIRVAIGLGILGGGGIGYELFMAMQVLHYQDALAVICIIIVLVLLIEKLSDWLRKLVTGKEKI